LENPQHSIMETETQKKVLFVYIGSEQGAWGTIAYPKLQHYYVMPGILYCAAALRESPELPEPITVSCLYLNSTVQDSDEMLAAISSENADCIGFSTFCWNEECSLNLARTLKSQSPDLAIMLGGPEIHCDSETASNEFFKTYPFVDSLVFGESEGKIGSVVKKMLFTPEDTLEGVAGYAFSPKLGGQQNFERGILLDPAIIPSPFPASFDIKKSENCGIAMVYEGSRGCPYRCIYCKFSHMNHKPRLFPLARVQEELSWLLEQRIDCIHCADAVFDLDPQRAKDILNTIVSKNIRTSTFFYCSFTRLDHELAELFEKVQCQIGVGVQSTNREVLRTLKRALSQRLFDETSELLQHYTINFYTDLIFGLPRDNFESFTRSLNQTLTLTPRFLMLFPLTLINGTELERNIDHYNVRRYEKAQLDSISLLCDIEYENIVLYKDFTLSQLEQFDDITLTCFYFYNRFTYSLGHLLKRWNGNGALLYAFIGKKTKEWLSSIGKKASNTESIEGFEDEIKRIFIEALKVQGAGEKEKTAFLELFKLDIYRILMLEPSARQRLFNNAEKQKNRPRRGDEPLCLTVAWTKNIQLTYPFNDLQKLNELRETIEPCQEEVLLSAPFSRFDVSVAPLNRETKTVLACVPSDRAARLKSIISSATRQIARKAGETDTGGVNIEEILQGLMAQGIVTVF